MDLRKVILALLLIVFFIVVLYQAMYLKSPPRDDRMSRRKAMAPHRREEQLRVEEIQLPRLHLELLKGREAIQQPSGRNLFSLSQEEDWQSSALKQSADEAKRIESAPVVEVLKPTEKKVPKVKRIKNVRFIGFAQMKGIRVAGIMMEDNIFLGLEGDVIAKKFNIIKISDKYMEIGIPNTDQRQRLPLEGG